MADCTDSEDATSSVGDEERARRLFQACDGDGDGFIDSHDLLNICRELNLEDSVEELMKELGADEQGKISYEEFFKRRLALRSEIEAFKINRPQGTEYLPTSSENSLGEGKMSWEFDSGARDLSPEPHSFRQLVASRSHPVSGNLLELANKLHEAALSSLKNEIVDLSNKLQCVTSERDHFEKSLQKSEIERHKAEQKLEEELQVHEEQLTELHSVIAELTKKVQYQQSLVIREEEYNSETEEIEANTGVEVSQTNIHEEINEIAPSLDTSADSEDSLGEGEPEVLNDPFYNANNELKEELSKVRAENGILQEKLTRALNDLEAISKLNNRKLTHEVPNSFEVVRVAHVSSSSQVIGRTSPSLVTQGMPTSNTNSPRRRDRNFPMSKLAERVILKKVDNQITEKLNSNLQEGSGFQELKVSDLLSKKQLELEIERLNCKLDHILSQNTVLSLTLGECKTQCDKLSLLVGKYESNAMALKLALNCSDQALQVCESLLHLLETELGLFLSVCQGKQSVDFKHENEDKILRKATENRREAERHAKEVLDSFQEESFENRSFSEWNINNEAKLRELLNRLKSERNLIKTTVVELESPHVQLPANVMTVSEARKLDLETAVLMQELMSLREDKAELRARIHYLEKDRSAQEIKAAAQNSQFQSLLQAIRQLQCQINEEKNISNDSSVTKSDLSLKDKMEELIETVHNVTKYPEFQQQNFDLVLDLRAENTALISELDKCKKRYQSRVKKLEAQVMPLVEKHAQQANKLKEKMAILEKQIQFHEGTDCHKL